MRASGRDEAHDIHALRERQELAAMMEPPITKPAMNNRMKKLAAIAKETVQ